MYEAFFGLRSRPFAAAPFAERYFPAGAIEGARQVLGRCIERAEGAGLLIGPAGTGKSLLGLVLADQFRTTFDIAYLASGRIESRRELLQGILFELNLPYRGMEEGELRLSLIDYLSQPTSGRQGMFLFVDEAHTLPLKLLEELRLITNLVRNGTPRVRLVLAGGPVLEERFAHPKLESFNQRLAARCYLEGLDRNETFEYAKAQLRSAGGNPDQVFTTESLDAIYRATDGIARLINQVCDHALILAFANGIHSLDKSVIEEAWADLQQLPTPWNTAKGAEAAVAENEAQDGSIIEFGTLDEEDSEDEPAAVPFRPLAAATVSPLPEPDLLDTLEPDIQVEEIQTQLAAIESDFHPLSTHVTTVDVVYPPAEHPFQEAFEEEEVVVDRYASLEASTFHNRPQVRSREGQELARLLAPFDKGTSNSKTASTTNTATTTETIRVAPVESPKTITEITLQAAESSTRVIEIPDDDSDLLVVEELPQESQEVTATVRRQEYRQLFANLRRG